MAKTKVFRKKTLKKSTKKRKMSINCKKPKGFSQKQYCKYRRKKNRKSHKKGGMRFYRFDLSDDEKIKRDKYIKQSKHTDENRRPGQGSSLKTPYGNCILDNKGKEYCSHLFPSNVTHNENWMFHPKQTSASNYM